MKKLLCMSGVLSIGLLASPAFGQSADDVLQAGEKLIKGLFGKRVTPPKRNEEEVSLSRILDEDSLAYEQYHMMHCDFIFQGAPLVRLYTGYNGERDESYTHSGHVRISFGSGFYSQNLSIETDWSEEGLPIYVLEGHTSGTGLEQPIFFNGRLIQLPDPTNDPTDDSPEGGFYEDDGSVREPATLSFDVLQKDIRTDNTKVLKKFRFSGETVCKVWDTEGKYPAG